MLHLSIKYLILLSGEHLTHLHLQSSDMPSFIDLRDVNESTDTELVIHPKSDPLTIPLPLPPKEKFLSNSLPNSATSSPRFGSNLSKKRNNQNQQPSPLSNNPLARQNSVALTNLERLEENLFRRSSSCIEGRSSVSPEKYDHGLTKVNTVKNAEDNKVRSFLSKTDKFYKCGGGGGAQHKRESYEEKFKCGAMCLFIPALGKAKPVRARREETGTYDMGYNVSRKVSLEKFECRSWTSSAIVNLEEHDENESNLFFDLPMELIRCSSKDTCSPVTTAFVFDKELPKGVLKNTTTKTADRKSVRFSTSSPETDSPKSCVTPRVHKAREDFNAFLEAQCA